MNFHRHGLVPRRKCARVDPASAREFAARFFDILDGHSPGYPSQISWNRRVHHEPHGHLAQVAQRDGMHGSQVVLYTAPVRHLRSALTGTQVGHNRSDRPGVGRIKIHQPAVNPPAEWIPGKLPEYPQRSVCFLSVRLRRRFHGAVPNDPYAMGSVISRTSTRMASRSPSAFILAKVSISCMFPLTLIFLVRNPFIAVLVSFCKSALKQIS
jgi:hypothetical protein